MGRWRRASASWCPRASAGIRSRISSLRASATELKNKPAAHHVLCVEVLQGGRECGRQDARIADKTLRASLAPVREPLRAGATGIAGYRSP
jgi:hypothetical protein